MTQQPYQQQQGYPGQPNYAPAPGYPPAAPQAQFQQPQYPPQQPGYGVQPYQPAPGANVPAPVYPSYQQNGYGQQPPRPPQPELPRGSLKDYVEQPAGGFGPSLAFPQVGTQYWCTVARNVGDPDIKPQTDMITGEVRTFPDGRVKWMMCVPVLTQPSPQYPEGTATWYVKGNDRTELTRAMEAAGVGIDPATGTTYPPRAGDTFHVHFTHESASSGRGRNPGKVKRVTYTMGTGEAPVQQVVQGQVVQQGQLPQQGYQQYGPQSAMQMAQPAPAQYPQPQVQQPDPNMAYQQATGQQMPGAFGQPVQAQQQPGPYGQPNADWNPYAQQPQQVPNGPQVPGNTNWQQPSYQQNVPPTPTPAPPAPGGPPSGPAQPSGAPSPSYPQPGPAPVQQSAPSAPTMMQPAGSGPPPDWPADVPFIPGLTPDMARVAKSVRYPGTVPQQ